MRTVEEILEDVQHLSPRDIKRLMDRLEDLAEGESDESAAAEAARLAALDSFIELAGTAHTDYTDVSSDKYKHLAEIYADTHEDK